MSSYSSLSECLIDGDASSPRVVSFFPDFQEKVRSALNTILGDAVEKRVTFLVVEDADAIGGKALLIVILYMDIHSAQTSAALGVYELEGRSK